MFQQKLHKTTPLPAWITAMSAKERKPSADLYANYNKLVEPIKSSFDVTAGYDYQYWKATNPLYSEMNTLGEVLKTSKATDERHVLLSYYGRLTTRSTHAIC